MNAAKIARYYPAYCDMLRRKITAGRDLLTLMENVLRAEVLQASATRYLVTLCDQDETAEHYDHLGLATRDALREFVPGRVYRWAQGQLPTIYPVGEMGPSGGWLVSLQTGQRAIGGAPGQPVPATTRPASQFAYYQGSLNDVLPVLRGLGAHQAKRRKRARRLLAQLWAYHWQQQASPLLVATAEQEGGCYA